MDTHILKKVYQKLEYWLSDKNLNINQKEAIRAMLQGLIQGERILLLEMPTGSGKFLVLVTLLQFLFENGAIKKALFLSPRRETAEQILNVINEKMYLNIGESLRKGVKCKIISTTYNDLIKNNDIFMDYDFVICIDIKYTKNSIINELFVQNRETVCYLGVENGGFQDKFNSIFANTVPVFKYTVQDTINVSEKSFINDFLQSLFINLGYTNIQVEPHIQAGNKNDIMLCPDILISENQKSLILIAAKTYRSRYISQSNIMGALQQIKTYKSFIKSEEYVLILTCELGQEIKTTIYKETGIHLWDIANLIYLCNNSDELINRLSDQIPFPIQNIKPIPLINREFIRNYAPLFFDQTVAVRHTADLLKERLKLCKTGRLNKADQEYENICVDIILFLFKQEFTQFSTQHKTSDRIFRMDLLCGLKGSAAFWEFLIRHYNTKFIVFEFKNYAAKLSQNLIYVTEKYLFNVALRNVAIIISRKGFQNSAFAAAMGSLKESGKLILDITDNDLFNMIELKADGREPSDYLLSKVENILMSVSK